MKIYSYRIKALEKDRPDAVINFSKNLEKVFNYYHSPDLDEDGQYDRRQACKITMQSLVALDRVARREGIGKSRALVDKTQNFFVLSQRLFILCHTYRSPFWKNFY